MSKMTNRYKISGNGVFDKINSCSIPADENNRHYREYLEWLDQGNTPDPEFTQEEIDAAAAQEEIANLRHDLIQAARFQFRLVEELWRIMKLHTAATNADLNPTLAAKFSELKAKSDRLLEIDE